MQLTIDESTKDKSIQEIKMMETHIRSDEREVNIAETTGKPTTTVHYNDLTFIVSIADYIDACCRSLCKDPAAAGG